MEKLDRLEGEALRKALARLADSGPADFDLFVTELRREGQTFGFRHQAVRILEMRDTPESRGLLKEMALGRHTDGNPDLERWAAQAYLACVKDPRAAVDLLDSKAGPVLNLALLSIRGLAVDAPLMKRLDQLSSSSGRAVRICTTQVLAADRVPRFPSEAMEAITKAVSTAASQPDADQIPARGYYTNKEQEYSVYANALATIKVSDEHLRRRAAAQNGDARSLLYIALGRRGDGSARPALMETLRQSGNGMIRAWAARVLGQIGTEDDLALLRHVAETDPLERERSGDVPVPGSDKRFFPVREAARSALRQIEKRKQDR
ncbi:MAG TPA: HEAT repeat domain-containing protein [Planctomycetota bacterium]|nr:HEAT repeat domain-containing protein [Planctomycetota bacterium]